MYDAATTLVLPGTLFATVLALLMAGITLAFQIRKERMPAATRFENVNELVANLERQLVERRDELRDVEQKIQQRDRLAAEVGALDQRLEALRAEHAALAGAREEIDAVKREAADAAQFLAVARQELDLARSEVEAARKEIEDFKRELASRAQELEEIARDLEVTKRISVEQKQALEDALEHLREEKRSLEGELPRLRAERDSSMQRISEGHAAEARRQALLVEIERIEEEVADLDVKRHELAAIQEQLNAARLDERRVRDEALQVINQRGDLLAQVAQLGAEIGARTEELAQIKEAIRTQSKIGDVTPSPEDLLKDLIQMPACLAAPVRLGAAHREEADALAQVDRALKDSGLEYSNRTLRAFHTSLKINDNAQLTVLAGVSGTGKSLLPRRYAEAMGIHFLQIAVEPRWDSPQDLLGFYNYIET